MTTTLGDFHSTVSAEVKRGNSLDSIIPGRVKLAVQFLERNYTAQYMKTFLEVTLNPEAGEPRVVALPSEIKSVRWLKIAESEIYYDLKSITPQDMRLRPTAGMPEKFWKSGTSRLILDRVPDKAYVLEGELMLFTDWPTDTNATHYLLNRASDLLLAQTMIHLGNYLRDDQIIKQYRGARDESLRTYITSEVEGEFDGMDAQMAYSPHYGIPDSYLVEGQS